jgi:hypothetical protein
MRPRAERSHRFSGSPAAGKLEKSAVSRLPRALTLGSDRGGGDRTLANLLMEKGAAFMGAAD